MKTKPTIAERNALANWQMVYGRHWRSALWATWQNGDYRAVDATSAAHLQGLRNRLGSRWPATYRLERR